MQCQNDESLMRVGKQVVSRWVWCRWGDCSIQLW